MSDQETILQSPPEKTSAPDVAVASITESKDEQKVEPVVEPVIKQPLPEPVPETKNEADQQKSTQNTPVSSKNPMHKIIVSKITLNIGVGKNEDQLKKGLILLSKLSSVKPVKTTTQKRIPGWGLRPGLSIGCKVTVRKNTLSLLKRLLFAKENTLLNKNFDTQGNFSFGVPEYIDIEGLEYDPDLKIMGLEVAVTLERPGFRLKKRKIRPSQIGKNHLITKQQAIEFVRELGIKIEE